MKKIISFIIISCLFLSMNNNIIAESKEKLDELDYDWCRQNFDNIVVKPFWWLKWNVKISNSRYTDFKDFGRGEPTINKQPELLKKLLQEFWQNKVKELFDNKELFIFFREDVLRIKEYIEDDKLLEEYYLGTKYDDVGLKYNKKIIDFDIENAIDRDIKWEIRFYPYNDEQFCNYQSATDLEKFPKLAIFDESLWAIVFTVRIDWEQLDIWKKVNYFKKFRINDTHRWEIIDSYTQYQYVTIPIKLKAGEKKHINTLIFKWDYNTETWVKFEF